MTAQEFLKQLEQCLSGLQSEERENALAYYREYFQEAGEEHQEEAVQRLGSPQAAAQRIINEMGDSGVYLPPKNVRQPSSDSTGTNTVRVIVTIIVILCAFPFWITLISLWFALIVTVLALVFAVAVTLIAFGLAAVASPIQGILAIIEGAIGYGIYYIGSGILCLGLVMLLWQPVLRLIKLIFQLIKLMSVGAVKLTITCVNAMLGRGKNA